MHFPRSTGTIQASTTRRGMVPDAYGYSDELLDVEVKLAGLRSLPLLSLLPFLTADRPQLRLTITPKIEGIELRGIGVSDHSSRPIPREAWSGTARAFPVQKLRVRLKPIHPTGEHDYYLNCQIFDPKLVQPEYGDLTGLRSSGGIVLETGIVRDKGLVVWGAIVTGLGFLAGTAVVLVPKLF